MAADRHIELMGAHFESTQKEYLLVFITVQSLTGIAVVVLIISKFQYFACLA